MGMGQGGMEQTGFMMPPMGGGGGYYGNDGGRDWGAVGPVQVRVLEGGLCEHSLTFTTDVPLRGVRCYHAYFTRSHPGSVRVDFGEDLQHPRRYR